MWFFNTSPSPSGCGSFQTTNVTGECMVTVCSSGGSSIAADNVLKFTPACPSFQVVFTRHAAQRRLERESQGFLSEPPCHTMG